MIQRWVASVLGGSGTALPAGPGPRRPDEHLVGALERTVAPCCGSTILGAGTPGTAPVADGLSATVVAQGARGQHERAGLRGVSGAVSGRCVPGVATNRLTAFRAPEADPPAVDRPEAT